MSRPVTSAITDTDDRTPDGSVREKLYLPWLEVESDFTEASVRLQVERGLFKLTRGDRPGGVPPLTASFFLTEHVDYVETAAQVWNNPTLQYQFVRGKSSAQEACFATEDGSLLRIDFERRHLTAALRATTFTAPHSTWGDLLLAPLTEYWREHGCFPLHAGAVDLDGESFLVSGYSGSGKTTLCLACLAAGGTWRADDKVIYRAGPDDLQAVSLYRNTNLHPETIPHFAGLSFTLDRPPIDETNEKRPCLLEELPVRYDLTSFTPSALLFPTVADSEVTEVVRLPPTEALLRLAGQSPLSSHLQRMAAQVRAASALVKRVPAFELRSGRDVLLRPERAAVALLRAVRQVRAG